MGKGSVYHLECMVSLALQAARPHLAWSICRGGEALSRNWVLSTAAWEGALPRISLPWVAESEPLRRTQKRQAPRQWYSNRSVIWCLMPAILELWGKKQNQSFQLICSLCFCLLTAPPKCGLVSPFLSAFPSSSFFLLGLMERQQFGRAFLSL